jgi:ribosomal peptide maturation radical SAM protein 1
MRIALVAMPWPAFDMPSAALGILTAVVERDLPEHSIDCLHGYVEVFDAISDTYEAIGGWPMLGEVLYASQFYREKRETARDYYQEWATRRRRPLLDPESALEQFARVDGFIGKHAEALAQQLAGAYDLVGFTTSYGQLFSSLLVARSLKKLSPQTPIVFGGMGVPEPVGSSVMAEYPFVDYVVQGEGEQRFVALIQQLSSGEDVSISGVLSQAVLAKPSETNALDLAPPNSEVDLRTLPMPNYDAYHQLAEDRSLFWHIPVEGSRGCWWNRVASTGDPKNSCFFCGLNVSSYREKGCDQIAEEMDHLSGKYCNLRFRFLDNVLRHKGVEELTEKISHQNKDYVFFYEARAQMHPSELLLLWQAGCNILQFGIEGLSSSYLKRIGKGTSTIQNLQVMKTCFELGIASESNLLINFPGATQQEVDETARNILQAALAYQPAHISVFSIRIDSTIYRMPEQFPITNIRNNLDMQAGLPLEVWQRLNLFLLHAEAKGDCVDWQIVRDACDRWRQLHEQLDEIPASKILGRTLPLYYQDGGTFLEIVDRRDDFRLITLDADWRAVYVYCMEIRSIRQISQHFAGKQTSDELNEKLTAMVEVGVMFAEDGKYLSLAVAPTPQIAAARIRQGRQTRD